MKKVIHVNQHHIKKNKKEGSVELPVITCKTYKSNDYGKHVVAVDGNGNEVFKIIYRPEKPLKCGATVWIETKLNLIIT